MTDRVAECHFKSMSLPPSSGQRISRITAPLAARYSTIKYGIFRN